MFVQASVEISKESFAPSTESEDDRNKFSQNLILQMNTDDLMPESGAVIRNNPHLKEIPLDERSDGNNSDFII